MPELDAQQAAYLALCAGGVALLALVLALVALTRLRTARRALRSLGSVENEDVLDVLSRHAHEVVRLRQEVAATRAEAERARAELRDSLRHVAVVRYDAFGDMGGRLSFSAALLDESGDGLVLTSINGRSETRTYAKGVKSGRSEQSLSPEEEQAIGYARRGTDGRGGDSRGMDRPYDGAAR
ncbi:DUF4446 family protein [Motilibacter aurantiacus]|uniref:DUF4446 family protein n=1 Tax=Motilibacter aurantiacus TaxID=2714955 RepID=UPI0014099BBF|nr:DUF4446 family protein [Motilibacter aurantiacus]